MLNENAAIVYFLGLRVYAWGLYLALGVSLACACFALRARRSLPGGSAAAVCVLSILMGFAVSRLCYCAFDGKIRQVLSLKSVFLVTAGGYSMFGALLGAGLGAVVTGKALKLPVLRILDLLAPCLFLFIAAERLGEGHLEGFGISRPLISRITGWNLVIYHDEYEDYLATYLIESLLALLLFAITMPKNTDDRRQGDVTLTCMLLYGLSQVLMESLRFDQHMRFSFVSVQQILFMCLAAAALFVRCRQLQSLGRGKKLRIAMYICVPVLVALLVLMEFLIDRSDFDKVLLYIIYIALLLVPLALGLRAGREVRDGTHSN
ncbi:MAG: prolipoprotein diacylglyceryl transferase [Clostridia bacterium]|nr:prolipoprotein diacylglyceryl transferase [Clostridia bacterium]